MTVTYRHCPVCGGDLETRHLDARDRLVCAECGFVFYQNPAPAAGVIVFDDDGRLLWVQRKFEPRKDLWTLPAGFVEFDEHVEECAVRETKEETGLDVELTGIFNVYMAMDDPRTRVVLLLYSARVTGGELRAGDDASAVRWVPIDEQPGELAFRAHQLALDDIRHDRGATR